MPDGTEIEIIKTEYQSISYSLWVKVIVFVFTYLVGYSSSMKKLFII